ncbi:MAG: hypothetical protein QXJ28_02030 [Candidatus Pacearchaeota archaeon]
MRKIESEKEKEKKQRRRQVISGSLLIILMILSVIGFAFLIKTEEENLKEEIIEYNGIKFTKEIDGWKAKTDNGEIKTKYTPFETGNISADFYISLRDFYMQPLFYVIDNGYAAYEIDENLKYYVSRSQEVCIDEKCKEDLVRKNCSENIIVFRRNNERKMYKNDKCIYIEANYEDQLLMADRLIFKIFEIQ